MTTIDATDLAYALRALAREHGITFLDALAEGIEELGPGEVRAVEGERQLFLVHEDPS